MTDIKRPLKVFLCHASADKPAVRSLYKRLTADGVDAWLDVENLIPGQNWKLEIPKAIRDSDVVLVCLSENSIHKDGYVQKEISFALDKAGEKPEGTIFIIPARLGECKVPDGLSMYHWVDLFETKGYEKLMKALRLHADKVDATLQIKKNKFYSDPRPNSTRTPPTPKSNLNIKKWFVLAAQIFLAVLVISGIIYVVNPGGDPPSTAEVVSTGTVDVGTLISSTKTEGENAAAIESMALVPAGDFTMGSNTGSPSEQPVHAVYLDAYYIDKYEVSNALYKACEEAGTCQPPANTDSSSRSSYYQDPEFGNYPVLYVDWNMAKVYCEWRGAQLPTEAQWEKAAQGNVPTAYPWGDGVGCDKANYGNCIGDTASVDAYEGSQSRYGVYGMSGNVSEWVADWFLDSYYQNSPSGNPQGPRDFGVYRGLRGGSWQSDPNQIRVAYRTGMQPYNSSNDIGFRCAMDANQ